MRQCEKDTMSDRTGLSLPLTAFSVAPRAGAPRGEL